MDREVMREIITTAVPSLGIPLVRMKMNERATKRQFEMKKEFELQKIEKRANALQSLDTGPVAYDEAEFTTTGEVYEKLERLREEFDCQFCRGVATQLLDAPPEDARRGFQELRAYKERVGGIESADIDREEAERLVGEVVDGWEVVPQYAGV